MAQAINPLRASDMRIHNQKIILSKIYEARNNGISQSELVAGTGLRAPTLFRIFSSLEEQGLIEIFKNPENSEEDTVRKGRRPVAFTTKKDGLYTVGIEFWISYISFGIFDFRGNLICSRIEPLGKNIDITEITDYIVALIREALSSHHIPVEKIPGIGVAAPGQVDIAKRNVINYARIPGMKNYPLADELENRLGIRVIIHNNCSVMALGEYRYGAYEHQGAMFTFLLRSGVGGAFVNQQGVYLSEFKTLEPGHMSINYDGPSCYCGAKGCLQAYLLELDSSCENDSKLLFSALEKQLEDHSAEAEITLRKAADYLFVAIKSIMRFLSPRSFLILGNGKLVSGFIADHIKKRLINEPDAFIPDIPSVFGGACNPLISQRGASDLVISYFFT